jgi:hypothetical protein
LNLSDTFDRNFGSEAGGGSKPGVSAGGSFLSALGGGALPFNAAAPQPVATQPVTTSAPSNDNRRGSPFDFGFNFGFGGGDHGHHFGFNFGSARGGGGGAAGGVADRGER